jgi:hypothetical protein
MNAVLAISVLMFAPPVLDIEPDGSSMLHLNPQFDSPPLLNRPLLDRVTPNSLETPDDSAGTPGANSGRPFPRGTGYQGEGYSGRQPQGMGNTGRNPRALRRQPMMPMSPTDFGTEASDPLFPVAPTDNGAGGATPGLGMRGSMRRPGLSGAGAGGLGSQHQPFNSPNSLSQARAMRQPGFYPQSAASSEKAFSGHRPGPAVSPWQNLYRGQTGGVDNYTTLVRPELEQRALNQQLNGRIGGVQGTVQRQGAGLQETQIKEGLVNPNYFINYQGYFPGSGGAP